MELKRPVGLEQVIHHFLGRMTETLPTSHYFWGGTLPGLQQ